MLRGMKGFLRTNVKKLAAVIQPRKDLARAPAQLQTHAFSHHQTNRVRREGAWVLEFDIPAWGFRKGEQVRIFPNAPIYLGDIVALRSERGLELARYRDEYMGSVAGLAVRV